MRIFVELCLVQAARDLGFSSEVAQVTVELLVIVQPGLGLDHQVVDIFIGVFPVAAAVAAGIEQGQPRTVGDTAAVKGVHLTTQVTLTITGGALTAHCDAALRFLRNIGGHEVDHTPHVLRSVTYGAAALNHINGGQVTQRDRRNG
ncbi:hypothetical protein D3C84_606790 [compost metagenome]